MDCLLFVQFVVCLSCGLKFKSLGRHTWRWNERLKTTEKTENFPKIRASLNNFILSVAVKENGKVCNCLHVKCCCRKLSNRLRGLQMHQRSCRVLKGQTDETFELLDDTEYTETCQTADSVD